MSKGNIFFGQPIFSQMIGLLDRNKVNKRAEEKSSDRYCKRFNTFQHLITMIYGVTSGCNSLRELCGGIVSYGDKISHCKLDYSPRRSTLSDGRIDAIARGEIGNQDYSHDSGGTFVVTALDPKIELGGFTISVEDKELHSYIDKRIKWLTDNQNIGYKEWKKDSSVFIHRSKIWKRK